MKVFELREDYPTECAVALDAVGKIYGYEAETAEKSVYWQGRWKRSMEASGSHQQRDTIGHLRMWLIPEFHSATCAGDVNKPSRHDYRLDPAIETRHCEIIWPSYCLVRDKTSCSVAASHNLIVPSLLSVASRFPSGEKATDETPPLWRRTDKNLCERRHR
jgi:hypothetical protein